MIEIRNLKKYYGGRLALDVPKLTLDACERCALIGPNGSGKTTLLRILAGTLKPDAGTITFDGVKKSEIGYLPQKPYAFDLSVLKNVMLPLHNEPDARDRALLALERVGLTHMKKARGSRLSGGEAQRMALARLIVKPHKILLLDEPTAAADISANDRIERALLDYAEECGCMLLFSSHAPSQALRLGTRVVALDDGKIGETGPAADVLNAPRSESTKAFLAHWKI